jgi:hypothetical protein
MIPCIFARHHRYVLNLLGCLVTAVGFGKQAASRRALPAGLLQERDD